MRWKSRRSCEARLAARLICAAALAFVSSPAAHADETDKPEEIVVIGVTPARGVGLPTSKIPTNVQSSTGEELARTQSLDISDFLNRGAGSVTLNAAQNNPLQADLQFRGFTASPLLGLSQGIAVYQNGVRVNEVFGDTVNWDLIPEGAIASVDLIGGANPIFGQNALGGALVLRTKDGFSDRGHQFEGYAGSFGRYSGAIESGASLGDFAYFAAGSYFDENGWRDASPSNATNAFTAFSWHPRDSAVDLRLGYGDTKLTGNGAIPAQLLDEDRRAIFTSPDITENDMRLAELEASHWLGAEVQLTGNVYYRSNVIDAFNGDGSEFEECDDPGDAGFLCDDDALVLDQSGNPISDEFDAINNESQRDQHGYGGGLQATFLSPVLGRENQWIAGASYGQGIAKFHSSVEVAMLKPDRSTTRSGIYVPEELTSVESRSRTASVYMTDTLSITPDWSVTLGGRYDATRVKLHDRSGEDPDLNGDHGYRRFNPALGAAYQLVPAVLAYGGYSESSRAPTPVELACADPDAPCSLPNAFLADPPLDQVVAQGYELGLRGSLEHIAGLEVGALRWNLGYFRVTNRDDILFQSTGGATSNQGYFANVGDTRRQGFELGLRGRSGALDWFLFYSYVDATFRDSFAASSPFNPDANADGDIRVRPGDQIPGVPRHSVKLGADYDLFPSFTLGADLVVNSDQYLRGDESNQLQTIDAFAVVNLRAEYRLSEHVAFFGRVDNLFNEKYESFGLLGEPEEVLGPAFDDPRFLGPGAPIGAWLGVRLEL